MNLHPPHYNPVPEVPRKRYTWLIITAVILIAVGFLVYGVILLGSKFGNKVKGTVQSGMAIADSTLERSVRDRYDRIYEMLISDSSSLHLKQKIDSLRLRSDSMVQYINHLGKDFHQYLPDESMLTMLNKNHSNKYFIKEKRAFELKSELYFYRSTCLNDLPDEVYSEQLAMMIMLDEAEKLMPNMLKKFMKWENLYFDQPPQNVFMNLTLFRTQVRNFESALLDKYLMYLQQPVLPAADTLDSI